MSSFLFFVFKQKTAYEMRISDWSSDVCSADLANTYRVRRNLLQGICGAALASAMILPAAAQESTVPVSAEEEKPDDIVVMGIRKNLESAQNRKRKIGREACRERVVQYV